jgi:hypothetical protein
MAKVEIEIPDDGRDMFVMVDGVKIAKRGRPGTPQAKTWISLEPGWSVLDCREEEPCGSLSCFWVALSTIILRADASNVAVTSFH